MKPRSMKKLFMLCFPLILMIAPVSGQERLPHGPERTWVDLTHPFNEETIYWPTEQRFLLNRGTTGTTARGYYYAANRFTTAEHGGTHIDAPRHFSEHGQTVDAIPLTRLIGEAAVIDATDSSNINSLYEITIDDLLGWEARNHRTLLNHIVLLRTGWGVRWPDAERYLGTGKRGRAALSNLRFPGLSPLAADWLIRHRKIKAIGIDTASIDFGPSTTFAAHIALCASQTPIFENLANLHILPEVGCEVVALPIKIQGGSGGPLRIIARVSSTPDSDHPH